MIILLLDKVYILEKTKYFPYEKEQVDVCTVALLLIVHGDSVCVRVDENNQLHWKNG